MKGGYAVLVELDDSAFKVASSSLIQILATSSRLITTELPEAPIARRALSLHGKPAKAELPAPLLEKAVEAPCENPLAADA